MLPARIHLPQNHPRIHRHEVSGNGGGLKQRGAPDTGLDVAEDFSFKPGSSRTGTAGPGAPHREC